MTADAGRRAPWSLRQRLVLGIVALLAIIGILIGAASVLMLRHSLLERLDLQLSAAMDRSQTFLPQLGFGPADTPPGIGNAQSAGTLGLIVRNGRILAPRYLDESATLRSLTPRQQRVLLRIDGSGPVTVQLGGELGEYRVVTATVNDGIRLIVGLPMRDVNATTGQLLFIILVITAIGVAVAAIAATFVVRLALRPLSDVVTTATRVAEMELDRGDVAVAERVPVAGTSTEVGQVGTALNRLLEHVAQALAARHASERKVRQFVADASHELRTPLASIRGYSELTRRSGLDLPDDIVTSLARIESESIRMTALVEELLLLARLDEGTDVSLEPIRLVPILTDAVHDAAASAPEHTWTLRTEDDPVVLADSARLLQAISNLLANARVHTPPHTTVTTSVLREQGRVRVTVCDDGPGIPADLLPTLFERFVRGDNSRSRSTGSTGLGLAITRAIIEAHGGTITVDSEPGTTCFTIDMDAAPIDTAPSDTAPPGARVDSDS